MRRLVSAVAEAEGRRRGVVSLVFVDDSFIRELKEKYFGIRRATDVIAFPLEDEFASGEGGDDLIGEIYVSTDRALDQAAENNVPLGEEVARLVVHGLLHLFGYDDRTPSSRKRMLQRQESLLRENAELASKVARRADRSRGADGARARSRS